MNQTSRLYVAAMALGMATAAHGYSMDRVFRIPPEDSWEFHSLTLSESGDLLGVATVGETGYGKIFRISTQGSATTLVDFPYNVNDGYRPMGPLLETSDGSLWGIASGGNRFMNSCGSVFSIPAGAAPINPALFDGRADYGCAPMGALVMTDDGAVIGTTSGYSSNARDLGTIFRVEAGSLAPDAMVASVLYRFEAAAGRAANGANPVAGLVRAGDGRLYGAARAGGLHRHGTLFSVAADGSDFQKLHDFDGSDGSAPQAALTMASDGALWGTTALGGSSGAGTIFRVTAAGEFSLMHSFTSAEGEMPGALVEAADGRLYGAAKDGGSADLGSIFRIGLDGSFASVYSITDNFKHPVAGLVAAPDGALYGATAYEIFRFNGVSSGLPPTLSLSLSPDTISYGGSFTATWASTHAESCVGTTPQSFANGTYTTSGSKQLTDNSKGGGDIVYGMTCTGPDGSASASATLHVIAPPPVVTLTAAPTTLPVGGTSVLTWTAQYAEVCTGSGSWSGNKSVKGGSVSISKSKAGTYSYTLTCTNDFGSNAANATITFQ